MGFVFRFLAMVSLAFGIIVSVIDASRSVATNAISLTPMAGALEAVGITVSPAFMAIGAANGIDWLWTPAVAGFLAAPAVLVFAGFALIFYAFGYRHRRPARLVLEA